MKKIYIVLLTAITLASCDLNVVPETSMTDVGFWKTEADLRGACSRLYSEDGTDVNPASERVNYLEGFSHDRRADELVGTSADDISTGSRSVQPEDNNNWRNPYRRIYVSNNIIGKAERADLKEEVMNRWLAEAYFFRAYNYFELVKKFGDVPLILTYFETVSHPDIFKGRTSRETVIEQCYKDLEFAATWLPKHSALPAGDWGRVTRSSALALTARIGLYMGTLTKYHNLQGDAQAHLTKSITACEAVMKEGHALFPDFQTLFYFEGEGPTNKENIFVKVYGPNGAGTVVHQNSRQLENSVSLTRQMVDLFLYKDGLPREKSPLTPAVETSYDSALENRDPRLKMTVFSMDEEAFKGPYQPFSNQSGYGYSIKKGFMMSEWNTVNRETVDKMLIRYAEVLITYAEATYERDGAITDALLDKTVNAIRARAGFNVKLTNAFAATHTLNMRDEIRRERTVEFIDENMRYDDIIRWKIAELVLPTYIIGAKFVDDETSKARVDLQPRLTDAQGKINGKFVYAQPDMYVIELDESRKFNPAKDYLYPIPLREIALTENNIIQNPGWN